MDDLTSRITINPKQCDSKEEILDGMPDLEMEDLHAVLQYAARKSDHPILPVAA